MIKNEGEENFDEEELEPTLMFWTYDFKCTLENIDAEKAKIENLKKVQ